MRRGWRLLIDRRRRSALEALWLPVGAARASVRCRNESNKRDEQFRIVCENQDRIEWR
jgi:hypothetical protein